LLKKIDANYIHKNFEKVQPRATEKKVKLFVNIMADFVRKNTRSARKDRKKFRRGKYTDHMM
jgi:hypothetical protein